MARKQINELLNSSNVKLEDLLLIQDTSGTNFNITIEQLYDTIQSSTSGIVSELEELVTNFNNATSGINDNIDNISDSINNSTSGIINELSINKSLAQQAKTGYSHSFGFAEKPQSNGYDWFPNIGINYTTDDVLNNTFKVFSLDRDVHLALDQPYWTDPTPGNPTDIGLFAGQNLPNNVDNLFDFDYDFNAEYGTNGNTGFENSIGRIRLNDCVPGDQLRVRFDFNVIPQIANTTIETALWYSNRDASDNITLTFPLTSQPIFYGTGTVGKTYLNRVEISAWITSTEDINALTLPSIKSDNPVIIQPLGVLVTIIR